MSDNLSCPGCQAEYDATGYDPGDQFQCPSCQTIVTVPGGEDEAAAGPRMPKMKSRGTTRRTSRAPASRERMTPKMRVVNEAVGMGMTMPGQDPRQARRAQAAPPPADGGNKNMTWIFVGLGAVMVLGGVIFLVKGASSSDDGKKKKKETAKTEEKDPGSSGSTTPPPVNPNPGGTPPVDHKAMVDTVSQVLNLLKGKPQDSVFWKVSAPLLKFGPEVIGELIERFIDDQEPALVARAIVVRAARTKIPEAHFYSGAERQRIKADVWAWWRDSMAKGTLTLVSEADYLSDSGGSGTTPPPVDPVKPPDGVGNPPKPVGGVGDRAIARDLPQRLANYRRGSADQRDVEMREIRAYGKNVIAHLLAHLSNEDYDLAGAANSILQELTKQNFGNVPAEERKDFVKKWEDWWKANEASFTM